MAETMAVAEAREQLLQLGQAISVAVMVLRPHADLIRRYQQERRDMESFGHIVNPTLYKSSERQATDAVMAPIYSEALRFVETYDRQCAAAQDALAKVGHHG
ncbi:hypothetical protein [Bosea sp. (in: a-proteobacteria)]|uniref:hypothetical protein n=1 Tax=Bosea sp. (in: a-proteobacteria) TaxID=1871050 RepID=UPI003B3A21B0